MRGLKKRDGPTAIRKHSDTRDLGINETPSQLRLTVFFRLSYCIHFLLDKTPPTQSLDATYAPPNNRAPSTQSFASTVFGTSFFLKFLQGMS